MDQAPDYITVIREYFRAGAAETVKRSEQIIASDEKNQAVFYISSGYVRIFSNNQRGEQYTHVVYGPGEIFPLTWLNKHRRTLATYEALTDCTIYCRELDTVSHNLINDGGLAYGMLQQAVAQYTTYSQRVTNLEFKYASERVAYQLVLLANRFGERSGDSVTIIPPLTHQLLGSLLNLSRESVSREMEKLVRAGHVRYNAGRQIIVSNVPKLGEYAKVPTTQGLS